MERAMAVAEGMPDYSVLILWPHALDAFSNIMEHCEGMRKLILIFDQYECASWKFGLLFANIYIMMILELQLVSFEKLILEKETVDECFFGAEAFHPAAIKVLLKGLGTIILVQAKEEFEMRSVEGNIQILIRLINNKSQSTTVLQRRL